MNKYFLIIIVSIFLFYVSCTNSINKENINIITNQLGFQPTQRKDVVLVNDSQLQTKEFTIVNNKGTVVYTGKLKDIGFNKESGDYVAKGDFTAFTIPGTYTINVEKYGKSFPFKIEKNVNVKPLLFATRWLYLQRSGIDKNDAITGIKLKADYLKPAILWDANGIQYNKKIDVSGGWWDAGDYGKYVSPAATTVMSLLYAYQFNPVVFKDGFSSIPESGNGISDILDEAKWELDWLLKMQREDGAVHHKATTKDYPYGFPSESKSIMYVFDVSSQATSHFAGVMAEASIVYRNINNAYADKLLAASKHAWAWLEQNKKQYPVGGFQNPKDSLGNKTLGGPYSVWEEKDDELRLWACASLFHATANPTYNNAFKQLWKKQQHSKYYGMSEYDGFAFALFAYAQSAGADTTIKKNIYALLQKQCKKIISVTNHSAFSVALKSKMNGFSYSWGSNGYTLEHAQLLLLTNMLHPNPEYVNAAAAQLNYILGCNALNLCQMNGDIGTKHLESTHHGISMKLGKPFPGAIGEGPNEEGGDKALDKYIASGVPPAKCLLDVKESYSSNEPTIYANAAFIAVAAWFTK